MSGSQQKRVRPSRSPGISDGQFVKENASLVEEAATFQRAAFNSMMILSDARPNDALRALRIAATMLAKGKEN